MAPLAKNSGAIDYLYELNHLASDIYNHSLRVSILAGVIAKWMRFNRAKTQEIILAGFLHDIGKTKFSQKLLDKHVSKLTDEEYEEYLGNQYIDEFNGITLATDYNDVYESIYDDLDNPAVPLIKLLLVLLNGAEDDSTEELVSKVIGKYADEKDKTI